MDRHPNRRRASRDGRLERTAISQIRGRTHPAAARSAGASAVAAAAARGRSRLRAGQFDRASGRALSAFRGRRARFLARHAAQGARAAAAMQIHRGRYRHLDAGAATPICCSPTRSCNGCRTIRRSCGGCSKALPKGGVLAVQMPDNTREPALVFQREVGDERPVGGPSGDQSRARATICRRRKPITICSSRSARTSTSGTPSTIT